MAERSIWFIEEQTRTGQDFYIICDHKEITDAFIQVILDFYGYLFEKPERELTPNIEVLFKLRSAYREITGEYTMMNQFRREMYYSEKMKEHKIHT